MKSKFNFLIFLCSAFVAVAALVLAGCGGEPVIDEMNAVPEMRPELLRMQSSGEFILSSESQAAELGSVIHVLDELAELERAGSWIQGMAMTESTIRENAGDYAGAVIAAFKELSWAYGKGLIEKTDIKNGILNVLNTGDNAAVIIAAHSVLSFLNDLWDDAAFDLRSLFIELDEPDGFARWMILVCDLEKNSGNRRAAAAYKSIRARYVQFPEYWYRGARAFSGAISAEFAENCINSSADGPFAQECRSMLASYSGLKNEDGAFLKTKLEIESIIYMSVNSGNPAVLDSLLPLISLPDNPYTVYAVSSLRSLTGVPKYKDYFFAQAASAGGRLAERLSYICSG